MKYQRGFSAMETVIYATILAVVSVFIVNSILMIAKSYDAYRVVRRVNNSAEAAMERMIREIRLANDVVETSLFDVDPGRLVLNTINPETEMATTIEFFASSTSLVVKEGLQNPVFLISPEVELTNLVFREVASSTNQKSKAVKIELELKSVHGNYQKTARFYGTAILRGSYQ